MPQFAANLSFLYTELPFLDRFDAAAADGFKAVEFMFPYNFAPSDINARLDCNGLKLVLFNAPVGGVHAASAQQAWDLGVRGQACLQGLDTAHQAGIDLAHRYAVALRCPRVHMLAGIVAPLQDVQLAQSLFVRRARIAARELAKDGVTLMIEPINQRDIPGYFLSSQAQAHRLLELIGEPNVQVQMDLYHCGVSEGDVTTKLRQYLPTGRVGHLQIASVPDRQEPDGGELNYAHLFDVIDACGYTGWVGCEYRPRLGAVAGGTTAGLGWRAATARAKLA